MKTHKSIYRLAIAAIAVVGFAACTEDIMDDINRDKNHPKDVSAKFIVTDLETATAFNTVGGDFSLYASLYVEHETGVHNQMYNAEVRQGEPTASTTYNNVWSSTYANIKIAKIIIQKCTTGDEAGNEITLGVAKTMLAYNAAMLTDLFGDVPFTEAGEINSNGTPKYMQPKIDKQEDIYKTILQLVDEAIVHFDGKDAAASGGLGASDLIYGGNGKLWKKAAYGLKARYTMRLLGRSSDQTADLNTIVSCVDNSFASEKEEFKFNVYDGNANVNPLFGFSYSRDALAASQSLVDKYKDRNDPRGDQYFMYYSGLQTPAFIQRESVDSVYAAPNGAPIQQQFAYDLSTASYAITAPTQLLSYHEVLFLKAEALCRLNRNSEAEPVLLAALKAGFANLANTIESTMLMDMAGTVDLSDSVATAYFNATVKPRFDENALKETMYQKYFAFAGASGESVEAYNDYRRMQGLNENFIELENPKNASQFPLRFSYGADDVLANPPVKTAYGDGQYVYTEKIWWAGGSR